MMIYFIVVYFCSKSKYSLDIVPIKSLDHLFTINFEIIYFREVSYVIIEFLIISIQRWTQKRRMQKFQIIIKLFFFQKYKLPRYPSHGKSIYNIGMDISTTNYVGTVF